MKFIYKWRVSKYLPRRSHIWNVCGVVLNAVHEPVSGFGISTIKVVCPISCVNDVVKGSFIESLVEVRNRFIISETEVGVDCKDLRAIIRPIEVGELRGLT